MPPKWHLELIFGIAVKKQQTLLGNANITLKNGYQFHRKTGQNLLEYIPILLSQTYLLLLINIIICSNFVQGVPKILFFSSFKGEYI